MMVLERFANMHHWESVMQFICKQIDEICENWRQIACDVSIEFLTVTEHVKPDIYKAIS